MIDDLGGGPAGLSVTVVREGGGTRLVVAGEVDVTSAERLRGHLAGALDHHPAALTVDLGGVTFLDSTGLSALVYAHLRATDENIPLVVTNPRPQVRRLLDVTGLLTVLTDEA